MGLFLFKELYDMSCNAHEEFIRELSESIMYWKYCTTQKDWLIHECTDIITRHGYSKNDFINIPIPEKPSYTPIHYF